MKGRGKGKISVDLIAASCAAVLAVYAAGYSRTRDAARRFETQAKIRRAARVEHTIVSPTVAIRPPAAESGQAQGASTPPATIVRSGRPRKSTPSATAAARLRPSPVPAEPGIDTVVATSAPPQSSAQREIAPVPMPAEEPARPQPIPITRAPPPASAPRWRDGTYTGLGESAHGDIEARVVIKDGRIVEATIATCDTRYPCDVIDPLIHQPVERQSPDVDYMSHATESSDAYYEAVVAALEIALERPSSEGTDPK